MEILQVVLHRLMDSFDRLAIVVAGLIGALVASRYHAADLTNMKDRALFYATAAACAYYLSEPVCEWFGLIQPNQISAMGFVIGIFGASILSAIKRSIDESNIWEFIKSKFGGGS